MLQLQLVESLKRDLFRIEAPKCDSFMLKPLAKSSAIINGKVSNVFSPGGSLVREKRTSPAPGPQRTWLRMPPFKIQAA